MSADGHAGPFTMLNPAGESSGTLGSDAGTVVLDAAGASRVTVPFDALLLTAQYTRDGDDLVLTGEGGETVIVEGYFALGAPPTLVTELGAQVEPDLAYRLANAEPLEQYAQAAGGAARKVIGEVTRLEGTVTANHKGGGSDTLTKGATVYEGDEIVTAADGKIVITFTDDTRFGMGTNARMTLDNLVYNPGGSSSMGVSLLQGAFTFVSGKVAKTGADNMKIVTPVGTMGIRGTEGGAFIAIAGQASTIWITSGAAFLSNIAGGALIIPGMGVQLSSASDAPTLQTIDQNQIDTLLGGAYRADSGPASNVAGIEPAAGPATVAQAVAQAADAGTITTEGASEIEVVAVVEEAPATIGGGAATGDGDGSSSEGALLGGGGGGDGGITPPVTTTFTVGSGSQSLSGGTNLSDDTLIVIGAADSANTISVGTIDGGGQLQIVITTAGGVEETVTASLFEDLTIDLSGSETGNTVVISQIGDTGLDASTIVILGGSGDDVFDASGNTEPIAGTASTFVSMQFFGNGGNDTLTGGAGDDVLSGGEGVDLLFGLAGNDTINGGADSDLVEGGAGADVMDGDAGIDTLAYQGSALGVTVDLSTGTGSGGDAAGDTFVEFENLIGSENGDTLIGSGLVNVIDGGGGDDTIDGGAGSDVLIGGAGADSILGGADNDILAGLTEGDVLNGGDGIDTADYSGSDAGVTVALSTAGNTGGHAQGDELIAVEAVTGSGFDDDLTGDGQANLLFGAGGADTIAGGGGADNLLGGLGDDTVQGGDGDDQIFYAVGEGLDTVDGGADTDTVTVQGIIDTPTVFLIEDGATYNARVGAGAIDASHIAVSVNGVLALDIDNVEDLIINAGDAGDTLTVTGNFDGTDLALTTITFNGGAGADTLDISHLASAHDVAFNNVETVIDNAAPVAADDAVATNEDTVLAGDVLADNGSGPDDDVNGDALTVSAVDGAAGNVDTQITLASGALLTVNSDGTFDYDPNGQFDSLGAGDSDTDSFTYTVSDGILSDDATVTVTITGVNDPAVIGGDASGTVDEDAVPNTTTGTLTATDVDNTDDSFQTVAAGTPSDGNFGTYEVTAGGAWTYTLANANPTVDALNVGGELLDSFTVLSEDGTAQLVEITIAGANDAAVIGGDASGEVAEDAAPNTVSGTLTAADVDNTDNVFQAVAAGTGSDAGYGTFEVTAVGGWTYVLNNAHIDVDALNVNDELIDTFTATSEDGTEQTVTITITGANDAPVLADASGTLVYTEGDGAEVIDAALTVSDVDNADLVGATVSLTGNFTPGEDVLGFVDTAEITGSWDAGTGILTLSGTATLAQYEEALETVTYENTNLEDPSTATRTVSWQVDDGAALSTIATSTITVNGDNDAPTLTTVNTLAGTEDSARVITFADLAAAGDEADVDGTVTGFRIEAVDGGVLTVQGGGAVVPGLTVINAGTTVVWDPVADANGVQPAFTVVAIDDLGAASASPVQVSVDLAPVNDAPVVTGGLDLDGISEDAVENGGTQVSGATIVQATDVDDPTAAGNAAESAERGMAIIATDNAGDAGGAWQFSINGGESWSPVGAVSFNAALLLGPTALVRYVPGADYNEASDDANPTITYHVWDGAVGSEGGTADLAATGTGGTTAFSAATADASITIAAVNDDPDAEADKTVTVDEDSLDNPLNIAAPSDPDFAHEGDTHTITVTAVPTEGVITTAGGAAVGVGDTLTVGELTGLLYDTDQNDVDGGTFAYTVSDLDGGNDSQTVTLAITPSNDDPDAEADKAINVDEGSGGNALNIAAPSDPDFANEGDSHTITVTAIPDVGFITLADGETVVAVDNVLSVGELTGLLYHTPGNDSTGAAGGFAYDVSDEGGASDSQTVTITIDNINDAPVTDDVVAAGNEDAVSIAVTLTGSDVDGTVQSFTLQGLPANGTLYTDVALTTLAATGVAYAAAGNALTLYFEPASDFNGATGFDYVATDDSGAPDASPGTATITVNAVNDAPELSVPGDPVGVNEDGVVNIGVTVSDVDAGDSPLEVTLSVENGALALTDDTDITYSDANGSDGTLVFSGTQAALNAALGASITYSPDADYNGGDVLTVTVDDQGATGAGGPLSDTETVDIVVAPVSDAPGVLVADAEGKEDLGAPDPDFGAADTTGGAAVAPPASGTIDLDITLTDVVSGETAWIVISGIPTGVGFNVSGDASGLPAGSLRFTAAEVAAGLSITALPTDSDADFTLTVTPFAQDGAAAPAAGTPQEIVVAIDAVADIPALSTAPASGLEHAAIALAVTAALTDLDGSEALAVVVSGIPDGATLSDDDGGHSFTAGDGITSVDISDWDLSLLSITAPDGFIGSFDLTLVATASETVSPDIDNGADNVASRSATLTVTVDPILNPEVAGTAGDDTFGIEFGSVTVTLNGVSTTYAAPVTVTIDGGLGDDTLTMGNPAAAEIFAINSDATHTSLARFSGNPLTQDSDIIAMTNVETLVVHGSLGTGNFDGSSASLVIDGGGGPLVQHLTVVDDVPSGTDQGVILIVDAPGPIDGSPDTLTIQNGGVVEIQGDDNVYPRVLIGGRGSNTEANSAGILTVTGEGSQLTFSSGNTPLLLIGRNGVGEATIEQGGLVDGVTSVLVGTGPAVEGGGVAGTMGTLTVDDATLSLSGVYGANSGFEGSGPFLVAGRGEGTTGVIDIVNGAEVTIVPGVDLGEDGEGALNRFGLNVGGNVNDTGGTGEMTISGGSSVSLSGTNAIVSVGRNGGDGTLTVTGAPGEPATPSTLSVEGTNAVLHVGLDAGSVGQLDILDGGQVLFDNVDGNATAFIARLADGTGAVLVDGTGSLLDLDTTDSGGARLFIGFDAGADAPWVGGDATLTIGAGATVNVNSVADSGATDVFVGLDGNVLGNGTLVGDVLVAGGVVAPGQSIGTLDILGNVNFAGNIEAGRPGGTFDIEIGPETGEALNADFLDVSGIAIFNAMSVIDVSLIDGLEVSDLEAGDFVDVLHAADIVDNTGGGDGLTDILLLNFELPAWLEAQATIVGLGDGSEVLRLEVVEPQGETIDLSGAVGPSSNEVTDPGEGAVTPAGISANLGPGTPTEFTFTVEVPEIPQTLDIFLLQDLSGSFFDDLSNVQTLFPNGLNSLNSQADVQFGVGSFIDKPDDPFGTATDFVYETNQAITDDRNAVEAAINDLVLGDGGDLPESQLEALLQVAVRATSEVGFRPEAQKFVILTTDALWHEAGDADLADDGLLNGSVPANDGDGIIENEDYPSVGQVAAALIAAGIIPIFAVTADVLAAYQGLVEQLGVGSAVELTTNSSNLVAAIEDGIAGSTVDITPTVLSDDFGLVSSITPTAVSDAEPGTYDFTVTLLADSDSYNSDTVTINVPGYGDVSLDITVPSIDATGTVGQDTIIGSNGPNVLDGDRSGDVIQAGGGDDLINYTIGHGRDLVDGGLGTDTVAVHGTDADETVRIETAAAYLARTGEALLGDIAVSAAATGSDLDLAMDLTSIEEIEVSGVETLVVSGDFSATVLNPATIRYTGTDGADSVDASGVTSAHRIVADGAGGNDTLAGGAGDDILIGGMGADGLTGGAGADSFQYLVPEDGTAWTSEGDASTIVADSLADFVSGTDAIVLDAAAFSFEVGTLNGEPNAGETNFSAIDEAYNGINGDSDAFAAGEASVIVDGNGALIYDANGSDPGYTVLASSGAGLVADTDVQVQQLT